MISLVPGNKHLPKINHVPSISAAIWAYLHGRVMFNGQIEYNHPKKGTTKCNPKLGYEVHESWCKNFRETTVPFPLTILVFDPRRIQLRAQGRFTKIRLPENIEDTEAVNKALQGGKMHVSYADRIAKNASSKRKRQELRQKEAATATKRIQSFLPSSGSTTSQSDTATPVMQFGTQGFSFAQTHVPTQQWQMYGMPSQMMTQPGMSPVPFPGYVTPMSQSAPVMMNQQTPMPQVPMTQIPVSQPSMSHMPQMPMAQMPTRHSMNHVHMTQSPMYTQPTMHGTTVQAAQNTVQLPYGMSMNELMQMVAVWQASKK
jgi:hypothetical protein